MQRVARMMHRSRLRDTPWRHDCGSGAATEAPRDRRMRPRFVPVQLDADG
jgi:hypothetical protein